MTVQDVGDGEVGGDDGFTFFSECGGDGEGAHLDPSRVDADGGAEDSVGLEGHVGLGVGDDGMFGACALGDMGEEAESGEDEGFFFGIDFILEGVADEGEDGGEDDGEDRGDGGNDGDIGGALGGEDASGERDDGGLEFVGPESCAVEELLVVGDALVEQGDAGLVFALRLIELGELVEAVVAGTGELFDLSHSADGGVAIGEGVGEVTVGDVPLGV